MGVYIPPNSNDGNSGSSDGNNNNNGGNDKSPKVPPTRSFIRSFLEDKLNYGTNPSFGLGVWGPLVPPPENKLALRGLTATQFLIGTVLLVKSKNLRNKNLILSGIVPSFDKKFKKYTYGFLGLNLIYNGALEVTRLILPMDPWEEERVFYTNLALKSGQPVHPWFGPRNYRPMNMSDFILTLEKNVGHVRKDDTIELNKINDDIKAQILRLDKDSKSGKLQIVVKSSSLPRLLNTEHFNQIYVNIHAQNKAIYEHLLNNQLKDVDELNKGDRLDLMMEGKSIFTYNDDHPKPPISLGDHRLETDDDLEEVWEHFEPWEELRIETDYDIRLIPKSFRISLDEPETLPSEITTTNTSNNS